MLPITGFYAALMGFLIVYLGQRVAMCRRANQIGIGGEANRELAVLIRAHANTVENVPVTLVLLLLAEMNGLGVFMLHVYGVVLVASRLAHAHGFIASGGRYHHARFFGILGNWIVIMALGVHNIALAWFG